MNITKVPSQRWKRTVIPAAKIKGGIKHAPFHSTEFKGNYYMQSESRDCIWLAGEGKKKNSAKAVFKLQGSYGKAKDPDRKFSVRMRGMYEILNHLPIEFQKRTISYFIDFQGRFKITVNQKTIFDDLVFFMGHRTWRFWPAIEFAVPDGVLKEGENLITIENFTERFSKNYRLYPDNKLNEELTKITTYVLSDMQIIENTFRDLDTVCCPEVVQVGEKFYFELFATKDHVVEITSGNSLSSLNKKVLKISKGRTKLYFKAVKPDADAEIRIYSRTTKKTTCVSIKRIVEVINGFVPKIGHAVGMAQAKNIIKKIEKIRDYNLGNLVGIYHHLIRQDPNLEKEYLSWIDYCAENNLDISMCPAKWMRPYLAEVYKRASKNFYSMEHWERGHVSTEFKQDKSLNLKQVADKFVEELRKQYEEARPATLPVSLWVMDPTLLQRYHLLAGADFPGIEGMVIHQNLNVAAARGTTRAYERPHWGVVNSMDCQAFGGLDFYEQWRTRIPGIDQVRERIWWISQYLYYLSGARIIETQSGVLHSEVNWQLDFEDDFQQKIATLQRDFYHFTRTHKLVSQPQADIAFVQGNYDLFSGGAYESEDWCQASEQSWRNISVALPKTSYRNFLDERDQEESRRNFSDTPYGEVDILPVEAPLKVMKQYAVLVFLGWNTITKEDYQKLINYVRSGGKLFMMLTHLSTTIDRDEDIKIINKGDLSGLFGTKVIDQKNKHKWWPKGIFKDLLWQAEFTGKSIDKNVNLQVGKKFPVLEKDGIVRYRTWDTEYFTGNLQVKNPDEIIMRDSFSKDPVLIEHKLGKGFAYLLNICQYPKEKNMRNLVQSILKPLLDSVKREVKLLKGQHLNYFEYNFGQGKKSYKKIFAIRNDWRNQGGTRNYMFSVNNINVPLKIKQRQVVTMYNVGDLVLVPDNDSVILDKFEFGKGKVICRIQGNGKVKIKCLYNKPAVKSVTVGKDKKAISFNRKNGVISVLVKGSEYLSINFS